MGGVDKAWLGWHGRPMVETVRDRLLPQVSELIISANRHLDRYDAWNCRVVQDAPAWQSLAEGPLVGMASALEQANGQWVVFAPCDAPNLPLNLVQGLLASAEATRARVAESDGRWQPVFCALHRSATASLRQALVGGERRPERFLRSSGALAVPFADGAAFLNVNHPGQLEDSAPCR